MLTNALDMSGKMAQARPSRRWNRPAAFVALVALLSSLLTFLAPAPPAAAVTAFTSKFQTNVNGDITFAANHNMTCLVGCVDANNGFMTYVDADGVPASPLHGGGTIATFNSATADVVVPPGSTVLFAGLFWGANTRRGADVGTNISANAPAPANRNQVLFRTPAMTGYSTVTAVATDMDVDITAPNTATLPIYHGYADVTALVQAVPASGNGTYGVANIQAGTGSSGLGTWGGWTLVVAFSNPTERLRNLNVFNGFEKVTGSTAAASADVRFGPFITPAIGPVNVKIGVVAQDGDLLTGDFARLNSGTTACGGGTNISDGANPSTNLFNSSISQNAANVTTRNPNSAITWGYDADIIEANGILTNGDNNACLRIGTTADSYFLDAVTTAIELPQPRLIGTKTGTDLNGGNLNPGDTIEYTIDLTNTGDDIATNIVVADPLPFGLTYVPNSLSISAGPNTGAKTDLSTDADQANFTANTANFFLGTGATNSVGGQLAPNASTQVKLRATVNLSLPGGTSLSNEVQITYRGATIPAQVLNPVVSAVTTPLANQIDLVVTKNDSQTVAVAGAPISYIVTVTNNGPQTAVNASVVDDIPALILAPTWSCSVAGQSAAAGCGAASGTGDINTAVTLGVNDTATYTITGTVDNAAPAALLSLSNTATASPVGNVTDTNPANNTATDVDDVERQTDIVVTKTNGITDAVPGTALTYTVVVSNAGPSDAGLVSVTDSVPTALTGVVWDCIASVGSSCTALSGLGNNLNTSATLIRNGTATYTISGTLNPNTPAGTGSLSNTATATLGAGIDEINTANNTATDIDNVTPRSDLSITKTDNLIDAVPGEVVQYSISVANAGPSTATDALITDVVPAALTGVSWTCVATGVGASCGAASGSGNSISTTATLPSGTSANYVVTGTLNPTTPAGTGTLVNTAAIAVPTGTIDPMPENNSATDTDNVKPTAELSITKTDGLAAAVPGSPITYTIVVSNAGPSTVTNASITDSIPASITGVGWSCIASAGASCGALSGTGNNINTTATLAAGSSVTYTVIGVLDAAAPAGDATLVNTVSATLPVGVSDPTPGVTQATDTDNVTPQGDLSITKTDNISAAVPGTIVEYTIVVSNSGPSTATNAIVTDTVPAALTNVTWTCVAAAGSTCGAVSGSGNALSTTPTIGSSSSVTYTVRGTLNASTPAGVGTLVNTASVAAPTGMTDASAGNNTATDTDDVTPQADLRIAKSADVPSVLPGGIVTYTVVVSNNGPSHVVGATITDTVPSQLTGVTWSCAASAGSACATATGAGNAISTSADLNSGSSVTLTITGTVLPGAAAATMTNSATVAPPVGVTDTVGGNETASADVVIGAVADLSISKTNNVGIVTPGTTTTYTITATNTGPNVVSGATVADTLPAGISSATWSCTASTGSSCGSLSGAGSFSVPVTLASNGTVTFTVIANIAPGAVGGLTNTATITAPSGITELDGNNNSATDTDTFLLAGDLGITKTDGVGITAAIPGAPISYTITVTNAGPSTAVGVQINDAIPATITGATWVCGSTGGATCGVGGGSGNIATTATVPPSGSVIYTVSGIIDPNATGSLSNTATLTPPSGFPDAVASNNSATDVNTLTPRGDLSITKTDGITNAVPGEVLTYTIVAANAGISTVTNAVITDTLPASLTGTWTCVAAGGATCGDVSGSGSIATNASMPPGGSATYTVVATLNPSTPDGNNSLVNTAQIAAPIGFTDTTTGNNIATDTDNVTPQVDLAVTKTNNSTSVTPGNLTTYNIVVGNAGPSTATNATISDTLPLSLTGATWTCSATGGASCATLNGTGNIATTATIPTGGIVTYAVTATLNPTTPAGLATLINTVNVAPATGTTDVGPGANTASDTDDVTPQGDLSITKTDGVNDAVPGSLITYTIVARNTGPSTAANAAINDEVPAAISGVTWSCATTGGATCGAASGTGNTIATTATLPSGGTATYTVIGTLSPTTPAGTNTLINTATLSAPTGFVDSNTTNNTATDTDNVTPQVNLSIAKTDGNVDAIPGTIVAYTITVNNSGPSFGLNTVVTDAVPASLTGVTWTCSALGGSTCGATSGSGNTIATTANVAVGAAVTYLVTATLDGSTPAGIGTLSNTARVAAGPTATDTDTTNNEATDTNDVTPRADLVINKVRSDEVVAGQYITYTISVNNQGPSNVTGATITDTMPPQLLSPTWTCSASNGSSCATPIGAGDIATTANILAAGTVTYVVRAQIDPTYLSGNISNTASASVPGGVIDPTPTNTSTVTDPVVARTDLRVNKTRSGALVAGSPVTYNVVVTNLGPSSAINATLTDAIPVGIASQTWSCAASAGATCATPGGTGGIATTYSAEPNASLTYTITAQIAPTTTGSITQVATVDAAIPATDPVLSNNTAADVASVAINVDLQVTKTDDKTNVVAGTANTYTIKVRNAGPSSVAGATVTDNAPSNFTPSTWSCVASTGSSCPPSGTGNLSALVDLAPSGTATFTFNGTINANSALGAGALANTASVAVPNGVTELFVGDNSGSDTDTVLGEADLAITKTDNAIGRAPGDPITYVIIASNNGPSNVIGATIADVLPNAITAATWSCAATVGAACGSTSGSGDISTTFNLAVGSTITYTIEATVLPSATGTLSNSATITAPLTVTDVVPGNNTGTDTTSLGAVADVSITKTDGLTVAVPGQQVTYTIVASNSGPSVASNVVVADTFGSALLNPTWSCAPGPGSSCGNATGTGSLNETVTIANGSTVTFTVIATVSPAATGSLTNTATATAPTGIDPTPVNTATDVDTLNVTADLSITKTDGVTSEVPGTAVEYTIVARNAGPSAVTGATVTDILPAALIDASWSCVASAGSTCGPTGSGNISDTVDLLNGGTATYTLNATVAPTAVGNVSNTASITAPAGVTDADSGPGGNNTATDTDTLAIEADLSISKTDGAGVDTEVPGTAVTYTIVARNAGPSAVTGATITDTLPAALSGATWTCLASTGSTCATPGGTGNINTTANLLNGGTATYTLNANIAAGATGLLANTATITAPSGVTDANSGVGGNNSATDTDTLSPQADLAIAKTNSQLSVVAGDPVTYTITASNLGTSDVVGATITDTLPATLSGATWTCAASTGSSCAAPNGIGDINTTASLLAGATVIYTVNATVASTAVGTVSNTATIAAPSGVTDPNSGPGGNNSATDSDAVTRTADLAITKTDFSATEIPGTPVTYTIVATNNGPSAVTGATITDTLPATLTGATWTCVASTGSTCATPDGTGNINTTANLLNGGTATYTLIANIAPTATGTLSNTATVEAPTGVVDANSGTGGNNASTDVDNLVVNADLAVSKTDFTGTEVPGTSIEYKIFATNNGPSAVTGATITDTLPATLTGATWTCVASTGSTCATPDGTGNINTTANLLNGGTATYTLNANIAPTATGTLSNTATVEAPTGVTDTTGNNTATDTNTLDVTADLAVTKTNFNTTEVAGTPVQYTIVATNNGPSAVTGATITDTLPATLSGATWTCVASTGSTCATPGGTGNINTTANLLNGGTATYTLDANISPTAVGSLDNTATITAPATVTESATGNNSATDSDTLGFEADLSISKTDGFASSVAGNAVSYTIVATNNGPSAVTGATITDTLPAALSGATWTCSASTGSSCATPDGTGNINTTADLLNGGTATYTLTATLDSTATGILENVANVAVPTGVSDGTPANNTGTDTNNITGTADLSITKTDGTGVTTEVAGTSITYTVIATNNGPSAVTGATITDTLPATLTGATWTCVASTGSSCATPDGTGNINTTANLLNGGTATYTLTAAIASTAVGSLSNTATIEAPPGVTDANSGPGGNNASTDVDTLTQQADVAITKTNFSTTEIPGTPVTYTIVATNNGPSAVTGATITDTLPATLSGATWACVASTGSSCATPDGTGNINTTANLLNGGTATYTLNANIAAGATGTLDNSASIAVPGTVTELVTGNNTATDSDTLIRESDLSITKTDGFDSMVAGDVVTYTIVATNGGPSDVTGATISDTLPAVLSGATWTCVASTGSACATPDGNGNINTNADLLNGGTATYTLTATLSSTAIGTVANTSTIVAPIGVTDDAGNNSATDTNTVSRSADLALTKSDFSATEIPGTPVTYTIVATNNGPSAVTGATITDTLPATLTGATWSCVASTGSTCATPDGTGNINTTADLLNGGTATYTLIANIAPTATGTLSNTATIEAPTGVTDPNSGTDSNNTATDTDTLAPEADLAITKTDFSTTEIPGTPVTYTVVATNNGPSAITGATITDTLPATLTGATWACVASAGSTCATPDGTGNINTTANLLNGGTATYTLIANIAPTATGTLSNTATIAAPTGVVDANSGTGGNNTATDTDTLAPEADLAITKTDGVSGEVPGTSIEYTIVATNNGPSAVIGATITDTLPATLSGATWACVASTGSACATPDGTGNINTTANLLNSGTATYTLIANIAPTATGTLSNTASIEAPAGVADANSGTGGNNTATDTDTLAPEADLAITKTDGVSSVVAGDTTSYTIVVINRGPSNVVGAAVVDTLPASLIGTGWSCVASSGSSCNESNGTEGINTTVDLLSGGTATYTLNVTVDPTATGSVTNTATVSAPVSVSDTTADNNAATDTNSINRTADLSIAKTDGIDSEVPGTVANYTIVARNAGPSAITGATITDALPGFLVGAGWTCTATTGSSCGSLTGSGDINTTADLLAGGSATYVLTANVLGNATGKLVNTASIVAPPGVVDANSGPGGNNSATDSDVLDITADLSITKTDFSATEIPGTPVTYTIVATNDGPSDVIGATITDTLPAALSGATWTCVASTGSTCATPVGTGNINTTANLLNGGTATYTLIANIAPNATGTLSNTATIAAPTGVVDANSGTGGNNTATDTDVLDITADLSIVKTDGVASAVAGSLRTYTIVATNNGPSNVVGAAITDTLPATLTGASWTCVASTGSSCGVPGGTGSIDTTADLLNGGTVTFLLRATLSPTATGSVSNTATITAPPSVIDDAGNNSATDIDAINFTADLSITKTDNVDTALAGGTLSYTIIATNAGPSAVAGVSIIDTLPASLTGATWSCVASTGSSCVTANGTGSINTTANLLSGGTATYTLIATVSPTATGTVTNTATVAGPAGITDPIGDNTASDTDTITQSADLAITKTDFDTNEVPGTPVTYTIVATNPGPSAVIGATIVDTLPATLTGAAWTCVASTGSTCATPDGTGNINTTANLLNGGTATYRITANIAANATGVLTNAASIEAPTGVTDPTVNNTATDTNTLNVTADLVITKTDFSATEIPGTSVTYRIVATNDGPSDVVGATITDTLSATLTGATWTCLASTGSTCATPDGTGNINTTANLLNGGTATYTLIANIAPTATGILSNTATVEAPTGVVDANSGIGGNNTATDTDVLDITADLALTKTDFSATEIPGTSVTYRIVATNNGPSAVTGATITDTLPATLTGATWTCLASTGSTCATPDGTGNINTTANLLNGGTTTYTLIASIAPNATGTLSNTAAVEAPTGVTDNTSDNTATDTDVLNITADLAITKTDFSATEIPGTSVTYTIVATNNGPSAVTGATITDTLPTTLTGATWTCVASTGSSCATPDGTGSINTTADLLNGGTATYTLTASIASTATGTLSNTATIAAPPLVVDTGGNNSATDTDVLNITADLAITKTDFSATEIPGTSVTYTIVATNNGPSAVGATITDTLPTTLTGATWTCVASAGSTCATPDGTGNINTTANLLNGGTATYTLIANIAPTATSTLSNTTTVEAPTGVTDTTGNNTATDTNTLAPEADLAITKTDGSASAIAGDSITYTIVATNNGPSAVVGATITDTLPTTLTGATWTCVASTGSTCATPNGTDNINTTANLLNGGTATYTLIANIAPTATSTLSNTATVEAPTGVTDTTGNNTATDTNTLNITADLAITKTDSNPSAIAGDRITYTIVATNNGPSAVTGATITDTLPTTLTGATWTCVASTGSTCATPDGTGNINTTANLLNGGTATYTLNANIAPTATGTLSNTATVEAPTGVTDTTGNNTATDTTTLTFESDLSITKTDSQTTRTAGTTVVYTIVATNNGRSAVVGATVTDTLPATLTGATWTCLATTGSTCSASGTGNINDTINLLNNGTATYTLTADLVGTANGSLVNTASITAPTGVTDPAGNNVATDTNTVLGSADLAITKTDGVIAPNAGDVLTYTIVASNNGPGNVVGATVTDNLPSSLLGATWTCVASSGSSCDASGSGNINDTVNLVVNGTATYTLNTTIALTATGALVNNADIAPPADVVDSNLTNNSDRDTDALGARSELSITKTHTGSLVPGSPVVYSIVARNAGPSNVTGVTVTDTLSGVLSNGTWTCAATIGSSCAPSGTGNINDTISLAANGTSTYTLTATINPAATGMLTNTATITGPLVPTDTNGDDNTAIDTGVLTPVADLAIAKTDRATNQVAGTATEYTIVVSNNGPSSVIGARVADAVPAILSGATWTCVASLGSTCTATGAGNIADTIDLAAGGTATYTLTALIDPTAIGTISNTATVVAPTGVSDPVGNNTATDTSALVQVNDLAITKASTQTTYLVGSTVVYAIVVTNSGPSSAIDAVVTDSIPTSLSGASWTCVASSGSSCSGTGVGNITDIVNIAVGGTLTYTLTATAAAVGSLTNTATVAAGPGSTDPTTTNNTANETDEILPLPTTTVPTTVPAPTTVTEQPTIPATVSSSPLLPTLSTVPATTVVTTTVPQSTTPATVPTTPSTVPKPRGPLTGVVFRDLNGSGAFDKGDSVVANAKLVILLPDGRQIIVLTDAQGVYTLPTDVPEGEYTVLITVPGEDGPPRIGNIIVLAANLQLDIPINVSFLALTGSPADVQSTWAFALMALGFALIAASRRRRRQFTPSPAS
jgi:uncharacterized repeat protein (TIGR01451 family)